MSSFPINFESFGSRTQKLWLKNKSKTKVWQNALSVSCNHPIVDVYFENHCPPNIDGINGSWTLLTWIQN